MDVSLDIPVKVVGILPQRNERGQLLKMAYALFERLSVYRYGRVELNLFISEREYKARKTNKVQSVVYLCAWVRVKYTPALTFH